MNLLTKQAFTLIELTIVIVIIALIGSFSISSSLEMIESANIVATNNRLDTIEKALLTFWQKNGRLPCPADATLASTSTNYGVEASNVNLTCSGGTPSANANTSLNFLYKAAEGAVPITTLDLPKDFIYDAWGKKIRYAVKPNFALPYASSRIPAKSSACTVNDTAIRIMDASGNDRSNSAIYALISFGKNGHGAHTNTGTLYNAGSTNVDELANCHCTSSAVNTTVLGNYIQRNPNPNSSSATNYFDDIVRYKERWQMTSPQDALNDDGYRGPDLAIGYIKAAGGTVYTYKNQCGAFIKQADLSPLPTDKVRGVAFTAKNQHLLVYSFAGCNLYKINANGTLTNLSTAFATGEECVYDANGVMDLSNNGYLAISNSATINLWKQAGDKFVKLSSTPISPTPHGGTVQELSFSIDATLLAVRSTGTTSRIYKRKGDSFSASATDITQPTPTIGTVNSPESLVFSPDGKYLIETERFATSSYYFKIWRVLGGSTPSFVKLSTDFTDSIASTNNSLLFSQDNKYFVSNIVSSAPFICKIDPNDIFCNGTFISGADTVAVDQNYLTSTPAVTGSPTASFSFSKNSNNYVVYSLSNSAVPRIYMKLGSIYSFTESLAFDSTGIPQATPTQAFDQILTGSTGGIVAFTH